MSLDIARNQYDVEQLARNGESFAEFAKTQMHNFDQGTRPEIPRAPAIPLYGAEVDQAYTDRQPEAQMQASSSIETLGSSINIENLVSQQLINLREEILGRAA